MQNKTVLFLGAGFSIDAKIPVQSHILEEMIKDTTNKQGVLIEPESVKFLEAYIEVGLFLLKNFTKENSSYITDKVIQANFIKQLKEFFIDIENPLKIEILEEISQSEPDMGLDILYTLLEKNSDTSISKIIDAQYYRVLSITKETIRHKLFTANLNVDLEDIFTIFDKSLKKHENWSDFTYTELDNQRHSLLRLFTYYFGKRIGDFQSSKSSSYTGFVNFCKENQISILTTNWDTVVEILFDRQRIPFQTAIEGKAKNSIQLCKLHGSINWFKCNCCGELQIAANKDIAKHLLDDKPEICSKCHNEARVGQIVLQPEIITPTMLKTLNSKLFRDIWATAAGELKNANRIIFIGYSLPLADFEIRYFLRKHIKKEAKIDVVLAPSDRPQTDSEKWTKAEGRYLSLFPANNISFQYGGYKSFFHTKFEK